MSDKNLKKFEKGMSGNPSGRPPLPQWVKDKKKLTQMEFLDALGDICRFSTECVQDLAKDDSLPIKTSIMAHWLLAARTQTADRRDLFDRLYGKAPEAITLTTNHQDQLLGEVPLSVALHLLKNKDKLIE